MAESNNGFRLMAVIVLYKVRPEDSVAFRTLQAAMSKAMSEGSHVKVLLYDNTPGGCDPGTLPAGVQYEAAATNAGLAVAYNRALEIAQGENYGWLLTLDQDTALPEHFLCKVGQISLSVTSDDSVAGIVPIILDNGTVVSPCWWLWNALPRCYSHDFSGLTSRPTSAFNSASVLRVSAIALMGGYNRRFWLDNLDSYLYWKLFKQGKRLYVAGDIHVDHQFSMRNMKERVTLTRYKNILSAGCAFWDTELGLLAALDYNARLFYRTFYKHWRLGHDPAYRRASLDMLKKRVFHSRRRRIEDWQRETDRWIL